MLSRILKGMLSSYYGQIITIVFQILSVPIFIKCWGVDNYANWIVIYTIPSVIGMMELGIFNVLVNKSSFLISDREDKKSYDLLSAVNRFLIYVLIVSILFSIIAVSSLYRIEYILMILYSILLLISNFYISTYKIRRKYHIGSFVSNNIRLIEYVVIISCVIYNADIAQTSLSLLISRVSLLLLAYYFSVRKLELFGLFSGDITSIKTHIKPGDIINNSVFSVALMLNSQFLIILIKNMYGESSVVIFNTLRTFLRFSTQFTSAINNSAWQELLHLVNNKKNIEFKKLFLNVAKVNLVLIIVVSILYLLTGHYFLEVWLGGDFKYEQGHFILLLATVSLYNLWQPFYIFNHVKQKYIKSSLPYFIIQIILIATAVFIEFSFYDFLKMYAISEFLMLISLVVGMNYEKGKS